MEEKLNAITHGVGTAFALVALAVLVFAAYTSGSTWHIVSSFIYGISMVLLYLASTLYHSFSNERIKAIFQIIDHSAIYLLIAGTYTPFVLVPLHGTLGWTVFAVIWSVALVGIVFQIFFVRRFKIFSTCCYLLMGWFAVVVIKPLMETLPHEGLLWLMVGGIFYSVGAIFYLWRRMPYNHAVWHLFVLAGSAAHFIAVFFYVLPLPVVS
ncbi:MAG: hemolysin III family protein [Sporomusaceae bacterium]|nr:hemolysin III family protein [Sporomusaceae bacterium]